MEPRHTKHRRHIDALEGTLRLRAPSRRLAIIVAAGLSLALLAQVALKYLSLSTSYMDLGLFMNALGQTADYPPRLHSGHLWPLLPLYRSIYGSLPADWAPIVLIESQAIILLASVILVWRHFGFWPGLAMLLYYPLWANALFDFHFDHLAVPLLVAFFLACDRSRFGIAAFFAAALVLVKEPFALQTIACGLYFGWLAWRYRSAGLAPRLALLGCALILFGAAWFYGATRLWLPFFTSTASSTIGGTSFNWLGGSVHEILRTLVTRPDVWLKEIATNPPKIAYLLIVFGLLGFIPLWRPAALIVALPPLMTALLSREGLHYYHGSHYTAGVIVPCIIAFRDGLPVVQRWWQRIAASLARRRPFSNASRSLSATTRILPILLACGLFFGHWLFASSPLGRLFWSDARWSSNFEVYLPTARDAMIKAAIREHLPKDILASVATQNTLNWSTLANRVIYLPFPLGVTQPWQFITPGMEGLVDHWRFIRDGIKPARKTSDIFVDYVVLDLRRPWFMVDRGCRWRKGVCPDPVISQQFLGALQETRKRYQPVFERDGFMILRRRNADSLSWAWSRSWQGASTSRTQDR